MNLMHLTFAIALVSESLMAHTLGYSQFTDLSKYKNFIYDKSGPGWVVF